MRHIDQLHTYGGILNNKKDRQASEIMNMNLQHTHHLVLAVRRIFTKSGDLILRIFTVPSYFDPEKDVLHLGNLKILKLYDFWIDAHELYFRASTRDKLSNVNDIVGKKFLIRSAGGRVLLMQEISDERSSLNYDNIIMNYLSKPLGVRIVMPHIVLAFSEHMYVLSDCEYQNADVDYYLGKIRGFLVGATVKTFYNILEKLKQVSLRGEFSKRKISFLVDLVLPVFSSVSL